MSLVIHPLVTARLAAEAGRMTFLRNYGKQIWLASPLYAVMGGGEPVLVDTSGSADVMSKLRTEPVEHIMEFEEALAKVGIEPADVRLVIHTHLMYDHCANSKQLPNARFFVQKKELEFAYNPHPMFAGAYQKHLFDGLDFELIDGDHELMPGIQILFTPGHTPGIQSVAVETEAGLAVITGFCCISENFEPQLSPAWKTSQVPEVVPPGIHTDMLQAYQSMVRVKQLADIVIPFHDLELTSKTTIPDT